LRPMSSLKNPRRAGAITVTQAILLGCFLAIGLLAYGYANEFSKITSEDARIKLNKDIQVFHSRLGILAAYYPPGIAYLENVGYNNVTVIEAWVVLNGSMIWRSDLRELATIKPGAIGRIDFNCPGCREGDRPLLVVRYLPTSLYNPSSVTENVHKAWVESSEVILLRCGTLGRCHPSGDWIVVDFVDPTEDWGSSGTLPTYDNEVRFRMPYASRNETVHVRIKVTSDSPPNSRVGEDWLPSMSNEEHAIDTPGANLDYPITVNITALTPGWEVVQREWYFGKSQNSRGFIDFAMLTWSRSNTMVYEVYVGAHFRRSGTYRITANLYDCNNELISTGSYEYVNTGNWLWIQFSVKLNKPVYILDVWRVELLVEEV